MAFSDVEKLSVFHNSIFRQRAAASTQVIGSARHFLKMGFASSWAIRYSENDVMFELVAFYISLFPFFVPVLQNTAIFFSNGTNAQGGNVRHLPIVGHIRWNKKILKLLKPLGGESLFHSHVSDGGCRK